MGKTHMLYYFIVILTLMTHAASCDNNKTSKNPKDTLSERALTYIGCGVTKKAFMKEIAAAYKKETGIQILISGGGATRGIHFVSREKVDLGGACRHKLSSSAEQKAYPNIVAWDALVAIVHPSNPINQLKTTELKDILTGKITNWKEVGGADTAIQVVSRVGKNSGVGRMARELIFASAEQEYTDRAKVYPSSGPLEKAIERNPYAIGISGISSARKRQVKQLSLDGASTDYHSISSGAYPLIRPLYLFTVGKPKGKVKHFIDFVKGPKGQKVIKDQGTVNLEDGKDLIKIYRSKMKYLNLDDSLWHD